MPGSKFFVKLEEENGLKSASIQGKSGNRHDKYTDAIVEQWGEKIMGTLEEEGFLIPNGTKRKIDPKCENSTGMPKWVGGGSKAARGGRVTHCVFSPPLPIPDPYTA